MLVGCGARAEVDRCPLTVDVEGHEKKLYFGLY